MEVYNYRGTDSGDENLLGRYQGILESGPVWVLLQKESVEYIVSRKAYVTLRNAILTLNFCEWNKKVHDSFKPIHDHFKWQVFLPLP